jgi:hypothetical protein
VPKPTRKQFRADIAATLGAGALESGLLALKAADSARISVKAPRSLAGSVDIDEALKAAKPNDPRWDYVVGQYRASGVYLFWIEIHGARTEQNVDEVSKKFRWLRAWLLGQPLDRYARRFIWISSGTTAFNPRAPQLRRLIVEGCEPVGGHLTI